MKKNIKIISVLILALLMIPVLVHAETNKKNYKHLNYLETLDAEEIEYKFESYKENDDAVTIYVFRGQGCTFCRAFLEYMNGITDEYGKYFKMETFEVWNDPNNKKLHSKIANFLGYQSGGVPFIIIGDEVFEGFNEQMYGDAIKAAIYNLYNTKKSERYDVFDELVKSEKAGKVDYAKIIFWTVGSVAVGTLVGTLVVVLFTNAKLNAVLDEIRRSNARTIVVEKDHEDKKPASKKHK